MKGRAAVFTFRYKCDTVYHATRQSPCAKHTCQAVVLCKPTCWYKLVVFTVRVVQELGEPPEQLPHVILLKHLMHGTLHTQGMHGG